MKITEVKRKKGTVYYVVTFLGRDANGKPIQRRVSAGSKRDVLQKAADLRSAYRSGRAVGSGSKTIAMLAKDWLAVAKRKVAHRTYASYQDVITAYIVPSIGSARLRDLKPAHIERALQGWTKCDRRDGRPGVLSPTSVNYNLRIVRIFLNWAVKTREIPYNPAAAVDGIRSTEYEANILTPQEFARLLAFAKQWQSGDYEPHIVTAAAAGLRRGELCGLRWGDVDFRKVEISVRRAVEIRRDLGSGEDRLAIKEPKGGDAETVAVPRLVIEILERWRQTQIARLGQVTPETYVFDADGDVQHPDTLGKEIWKIIRGAGVPRVRLHDLRHSFGSWLATVGTSNRVMQKQLRHKSGKMMERYTNRVEAAQRDAADALDRCLRDAMGGSRRGR